MYPLISRLIGLSLSEHLSFAVLEASIILSGKRELEASARCSGIEVAARDSNAAVANRKQHEIEMPTSIG